MIEEFKTHYSDRKYCGLHGKQIVIDQMKASGSVIVQCRYFHLDGECYVNFDSNNSHDIRYFKPEKCILETKIVSVAKPK